MSITIANKTISGFAIGEPGKPWGLAEKKEWRDTRVKQRSYFEDVVPRVESLRQRKSSFVVTKYGDLPHYTDNNEKEKKENSSFPLYAIRTKDWTRDKPCVFVTGGVHGYETSGVEGALIFLETKAEKYSKHFNILVAPCVSPWGYERIQRWNAHAVDPNRSFNPDGEIVEGRNFNPEAATEESSNIIRFLREDMAELMGTNGPDEGWLCHIDLHETTDTDETEFIPSMAARDGKPFDPTTNNGKGKIPDGFYLVQDKSSPEPEWHAAMIERVKTITHIAPADENGRIIGCRVSQEGVIEIPPKRILGLCAGVTSAPYRTTTEVYPDSPSATPEQCNRAQVACIEAALDHILEKKINKSKISSSSSSVGVVGATR